jgi:hypothetical protein
LLIRLCYSPCGTISVGFASALVLPVVHSCPICTPQPSLWCSTGISQLTMRITAVRRCTQPLAAEFSLCRRSAYPKFALYRNFPTEAMSPKHLSISVSGRQLAFSHQHLFGFPELVNCWLWLCSLRAPSALDSTVTSISWSMLLQEISVGSGVPFCTSSRGH